MNKETKEGEVNSLKAQIKELTQKLNSEKHELKRNFLEAEIGLKTAQLHTELFLLGDDADGLEKAKNSVESLLQTLRNTLGNSKVPTKF